MSPAYPRIIGHRGAKLHAPENTLIGIETAAAQGARMVEIDVMLTADLVPVVIHDLTLDRTTDGTGPVAEWEYADLATLDAGSAFDRRFAGARIPSLAQVIDLCLRLDLGLNIEIKPAPGREEETAMVALTLARTLWPEDRPAPLVSSFVLKSMEAAKTIAPDWPRGMLFDRRPENWAEIADGIDAATLNLNQARETEDSIAELASLGRPILLYTCNDARRARALLAAGATGIITDTPEGLAGI